MNDIIDEIIAERKRQIHDKGYTSESDDAHTNNELIDAAIAYCTSAKKETAAAKECWPLALEHFKPSEERRDIIKAIALLIAEVERIDRIKDKWIPAVKANMKAYNKIKYHELA